MNKPKYRKKAKVSLIGKKFSEIDPIIAMRLKKLHEDLFATNLKDIQKGKVDDETLRSICGVISHKMKVHPEFKNTMGRYVAEALNKVSNGINAEKAFRLGNKNAEAKINNLNLNIAYEIWEEMEFSQKKSWEIFTKAAEKYNKPYSNVRKIFYDHKKEIERIYKSTKKCSL